jgi:hypothetical protein
MNSSTRIISRACTDYAGRAISQPDRVQGTDNLTP